MQSTTRYIYVITCSVTKKVYVGQTNNPSLRWKAHQNSVNSKRNHPLKNALLHYGIENFTFNVVETCNDTNVNERECFWISSYNATNPEFGFNLRLGTLVHNCHTPESRAKISAAMKNRIFTSQHREKLSKASKGRKHTIEARQKMSKSKKGKCPVGLPEIQAKRWSGQGNPRANTTNKVAQSIRDFRLQNPKMTCAAIARYFDVSYKTTYGILNNTSYLR